MNKVFTPIFTLIITTNMFINLGDFNWTGVIRQDYDKNKMNLMLVSG